jgi:hypothetical protein
MEGKKYNTVILAVVLQMCGILSLTLKEEHTVRVFWNGAEGNV